MRHCNFARTFPSDGWSGVFISLSTLRAKAKESRGLPEEML
jgi:hypothetical protein